MQIPSFFLWVLDHSRDCTSLYILPLLKKISVLPNEKVFIAYFIFFSCWLSDSPFDFRGVFWLEDCQLSYEVIFTWLFSTLCNCYNRSWFRSLCFLWRKYWLLHRSCSGCFMLVIFELFNTSSVLPDLFWDTSISI